MFGNTEPRAVRSAAMPKDAAPRREIGDALRALRDAGVQPALFDTRAGPVAGGVTLPVSVPACVADTSGAAWRAILAYAESGVPATLVLRELGSGDAAIAALEAFAGSLRDRLGAAGLSATAPGVCLHAHAVPLPAYRLLASRLPGNGPRWVLLDALHMRPRAGTRAAREAGRTWRFLWRCRHTRYPLLPAYAAGVTTPCPLLGDEAAGAVLPALGLQVPPGSAWVPLVIYLPEFADAGARLDWERLRHALHAAVDGGEVLLDALAWPDAALARDAAANRRLAIEVRGLGDLAAARGADPSALATLRWLAGVVARVRTLLWHRSRALAQARGPLPSLVRSEPVIGWDCDRRRRHWQARWQSALATSAVRHRNLLVLSPYAMLPAEARRASDYLDLLPAIEQADAFCFAAPPAGCFGSLEDYVRFHRRAWAVMRRRHAASLVAAGV